jgi:hypothetical protein
MSMELLVIQLKISHMFCAVEISMFKIFKILNFPILIKWLKSSCCYDSHEVLCGGCIQSVINMDFLNGCINVILWMCWV